MGKNSRRRHVDKQRREADRRRRHQTGLPTDRTALPTDRTGLPTDRTEPTELPTDRTVPRCDEPTDVAPTDAVSRACTQLEGVFGLVLRDGLWAHGWQPDEVMRHIRRDASTVPAHIDLLATAIAADVAHHDRVGNHVHASWRRQTDRVMALAAHEPARAGWVARWLAAGADGLGLAAARTLLDQLLNLPSLPILVPPPGSSGAVLADFAETGTEPSPILVKIRALLAKAESTAFPAEAEAFTAKAQAMMTEARIDGATLRASGGRRSTGTVSAVRIALDEPYVASKRSLLTAVAVANDVRCVFHRGVDLATVVGPVEQLGHVDLLFTSLLIQLHAALAVDAASAPAGSHVRSRRYRSSFILGFAMRIGRRLNDARTASFDAAGADALPVLAADDRATSDLFDRLVGPTSPLRSSTRVDARGTQAGAAAADRASLREAGLEGSPAHPPAELPDAS